MSQKSLILSFVLLAKFSKVLINLLIKMSMVFLKLFKGAGATKLMLGTITFGTYSLIVNWRFALCLLVGIGVHESGHVWAMRRLGMATRGFYFIPFFGGMAVADGAFPSAYAEAYVGIMGPVWGFCTAIASLALYYLTGNQAFEVAACWMAFINLLNMLPVHPLDGGRINRSIIQSIEGRWPILATVVLSFAGMGFCVTQGYWLFVILGVFGLLGELGSRKQFRLNAERYGDTKEPIDRVLGQLKKVLGLPETAHYDAFMIALAKFRKDPAWRDDLQKFGQLREEYRSLLNEITKLRKRWHKRYHIEIFTHLSALYSLQACKKNIAAEMEDALTREVNIYFTNSRPQPHHPLFDFEPNFIIPPAKELQKLDGLRLRLLKLLDETNKIGLPLFARVVDFVGLDTNENAPEKIVVAASNETITELKAFVTMCLFLGHEPFEWSITPGLIVGGNPAIRWANLAPFVLLLTASDSSAATDMSTAYLRSRSWKEWAMKSRTSVTMVAAYAVLLVSLFLVMHFTGGHEAASGAVTFFKEF